MRLKFLFILLFATTICQAQTKPIAHKSHSGSKRTFAKAYKKSLFDLNKSNFGEPGSAKIQILDSVIALNSTTVLLKIRTSKVCVFYGTDYTQLKNTDFNYRTDTIVNHAILNKKNTVTFIKTSAHQWPMSFDNSFDNVVFLGFKTK